MTDQRQSSETRASVLQLRDAKVGPEADSALVQSLVGVEVIWAQHLTSLL